jgi:hypothetical protein
MSITATAAAMRRIPAATRVRHQRLAQAMPGIPGDLYDALRQRGISRQAMHRHANELRPRARFLLVDRACTFIRWANDHAQVIGTMRIATKAVFVLEVC